MRARDNADHHIVGEVLVTAIAIVLVAAAGVFFSGVAHSSDTKDPVPPTAASLTARDTDDDVATDTLRVLLVKSESAPFDPVDAVFRIEGPEGTTSAVLFSDAAMTDPFADAGDLWGEGASLYAPCLGAGTHTVTLRTGYQVVWQREVRCGEAWTPLP